MIVAEERIDRGIMKTKRPTKENISPIPPVNYRCSYLLLSKFLTRNINRKPPLFSLLTGCKTSSSNHDSAIDNCLSGKIKAMTVGE